MTECINCGDQPSGDYSLVLPTGVMFQDEPLCTTCQSFFEESAQFEVHAAPLLMRGGNGDLNDSKQAADDLELAQQ